MRAALRRRAGPEPFRLGELAIDYEQRRVSVAGQPVVLTATEYEVLRVLSLRPGRVLTYDSLLQQAWRAPDEEQSDPKLVHTVVKRLRRKLGDDPARPAYILNQRGVGYRMPGPGGQSRLPAPDGPVQAEPVGPFARARRAPATRGIASGPRNATAVAHAPGCPSGIGMEFDVACFQGGQPANPERACGLTWPRHPGKPLADSRVDKTEARREGRRPFTTAFRTARTSLAPCALCTTRSQ